MIRSSVNKIGICVLCLLVISMLLVPSVGAWNVWYSGGPPSGYIGPPLRDAFAIDATAFAWIDDADEDEWVIDADYVTGYPADELIGTMPPEFYYVWSVRYDVYLECPPNNRYVYVSVYVSLYYDDGVQETRVDVESVRFDVRAGENPILRSGYLHVWHPGHVMLHGDFYSVITQVQGTSAVIDGESYGERDTQYGYYLVSDFIPWNP